MKHPTPGSLQMALRQSEYYLTVYRRTWKGSVFSSFLTPLLYVVAMGVLLGGFISASPARLEGAPTYLAFVAPGLLAAQTMQTAVFETTYPVLSATKWQRVYFGMGATPLRALDIANAALAFVVFRMSLVAVVFVVVMSPFGVFHSVLGAVGALLASILVGVAVGVPVYAYAVGVPNESSFSLIFRLGVIPQFLFSGAFFPIANLGPVLRQVARVTPLYQGVDLTRMLSLGTWQTGPALVHLAYLVLLAVVFHRVGVRRLARRLEV